MLLEPEFHARSWHTAFLTQWKVRRSERSRIKQMLVTVILNFSRGSEPIKMCTISSNQEGVLFQKRGSQNNLADMDKVIA
jgi:hypothetical protein